MELPVAFCDEMKRILGDEYEDYLKSMEGTRKFGLRVNTAKISVEDFLKISPFELTPIPYVKNGFYYDGEKEQPAKHPYYFAGLYYLQDPSAMTPASRLPIEENDVSSKTSWHRAFDCQRYQQQARKSTVEKH